MKHLALFTEGSLEDVKKFLTEEERQGYADGFSHGASCYGAGSCPTFMIPEDINPETGEISKELEDAGFVTEEEIEQVKQAFAKEG